MLRWCLSQVCPILCCGSLFALTQTVGPWLTVTLLRQHSVDARDVCDATGAMSNCHFAWTWQLLFIRTEIAREPRLVQVGGCVEQNVEVPVSQSMTKIVDDPVHRHRRGADRRCASARESGRNGAAECEFQSPQSRMNSWRRFSCCLRIAFRDGSWSLLWISFWHQSRRSSRRPLPQEHIHEHILKHTVAYSGILCATQIEEKLAEVFSTSTSTLRNRAFREVPWSEAAQGQTWP